MPSRDLPREDATLGSVGDLTGNRVEPKYSRKTKIWGCLIVGVLLLGMGGSALLLKWPVGVALFAPGVLLVLVGLYSVPASGETKPDDFCTDQDSNLKIGWPYSIAIAVIPLVVLTALAVRNGVRLLTIHQYVYGWGLILGSLPIALVSGFLIVGLTYCVSATWAASTIAEAEMQFVEMGARPRHQPSLRGSWR